MISENNMSNAETTPLLGVIDTHAHIYVDRFSDDRDAMLSRARAAGVQHIVVPATKPSEFASVVALVGEHADISGAIGVHPHHAAEINDHDLVEVERHASEGHSIAIGEIGLDYYYDHAPRDVQHRVFRRQLRIARTLGLPAVIHNRDSDEDLLRIIEEEQDGSLRFQLHCFSSGIDVLERALALGGMISFTGNVTYKKSTLDDVVRGVPDDRIMIETDSPYLTPVPHRGTRNEPGYVPLVAATIASIRGVTIDTINAMTTNNARRFFGLTSLLLVLLLVIGGTVVAQPQPIRTIDTTAPVTKPFSKLIGVGGHFASSTYISGSTTLANGPGVGGWLTLVPLQPIGINWLQLDLSFTNVQVEGNGDSLYLALRKFNGDSLLSPAPNQHNTVDVSFRFTANPSAIITLFGFFGVTHFSNEFGVDKYYLDRGNSTADYTESLWGWNAGAGVSLNIDTPYGTISPTAEWSVSRATSERVLPRRRDEFFVSQPRIGLLIYPNFYKIFR